MLCITVGVYLSVLCVYESMGICVCMNFCEWELGSICVMVCVKILLGE